MNKYEWTGQQFKPVRPDNDASESLEATDNHHTTIAVGVASEVRLADADSEQSSEIEDFASTAVEMPSSGTSDLRSRSGHAAAPDNNAASAGKSNMRQSEKDFPILSPSQRAEEVVSAVSNDTRGPAKKPEPRIESTLPQSSSVALTIPYEPPESARQASAVSELSEEEWLLALKILTPEERALLEKLSPQSLRGESWEAIRGQWPGTETIEELLDVLNDKKSNTRQSPSDRVRCEAELKESKVTDLHEVNDKSLLALSQQSKQTEDTLPYIDVENDCEDQAFSRMPKRCLSWACRDRNNKLENKKGFMVCPNCQGSYGAAKQTEDTKLKVTLNGKEITAADLPEEKPETKKRKRIQPTPIIVITRAPSTEYTNDGWSFHICTTPTNPDSCATQFTALKDSLNLNLPHQDGYCDLCSQAAESLSAITLDAVWSYNINESCRTEFDALMNALKV